MLLRRELPEEAELLALRHENAVLRRQSGRIRPVLGALRIPPAPERHTDTTWRQLLHAQAATVLAADFLHVHCALTLQRLYCLFVIKAGSRYVHFAGVTAHPDGPWTTQQIRNMLMDLGDRAADFRFLVRDRAGQFTNSPRCTCPTTRWQPLAGTRQAPARPRRPQKRIRASRVKAQASVAEFRNPTGRAGQWPGRR